MGLPCAAETNGTFVARTVPNTTMLVAETLANRGSTHCHSSPGATLNLFCDAKLPMTINFVNPPSCCSVSPGGASNDSAMPLSVERLPTGSNDGKLQLRKEAPANSVEMYSSLTLTGPLVSELVDLDNQTSVAGGASEEEDDSSSEYSSS